MAGVRRRRCRVHRRRPDRRRPLRRGLGPRRLREGLGVLRALTLVGVLALAGVPARAAGVALAGAPARAAAVTDGGRQELRLPGVPAARTLARGRVLVLRPHRLEIALDGRVRRVVAVRQPVDLAELPALVADPAYLALVPGRRGERRLRLGAVLAQLPGTTLTGTGPTLELGDTGGAGPARLVGMRARLTLTGATVLGAGAVPRGPARAGRGNRALVTAGLRYLEASEVRLDDTTLSGLGAAGVPALRVDGGSTLALRRVAVTLGGGVDVRDPARLTVDHLIAAAVTGDALDVVGGRGARVHDLRSTAATGAALRLHGSAGTGLDGLSSGDDAHALVTSGVEDLHADGVLARGSGLALGGRGIALAGPDVEAPAGALRVAAGADVTVTGGALRGLPGAVIVAPGGRALLSGVRTRGVLRGDVRLAPAPPSDAVRAAPGAPVSWDWAMRGAAAVVLLAGALLEVLRGRARRAGPRAATADGGELVLDLGESVLS